MPGIRRDPTIIFRIRTVWQSLSVHPVMGLPVELAGSAETAVWLVLSCTQLGSFLVTGFVWDVSLTHAICVSRFGLAVRPLGW